jgi:hypothetical protein
VGEGQGQTKAFLNFLCIWIDKEQVFFILYLPQISLNKSLFAYGTPFHTPQVACCHTKTQPELSVDEYS